MDQAGYFLDAEDGIKQHKTGNTEKSWNGLGRAAKEEEKEDYIISRMYIGI